MTFDQILLGITAILLLLSAIGWVLVEPLRKNGSKEKKAKGGKDERTSRV